VKGLERRSGRLAVATDCSGVVGGAKGFRIRGRASTVARCCARHECRREG
jgi:hypothetical protein